MLKLIIEDDEGRKTVVPFVREEITIGRQEGNTIRLTERNVSRRHARLMRQNGHVVVEDLGSSNGTRINGERISGQSQVKDGDLIQIGDYDLALQSDTSAQATLPPRRSMMPSEESAEADSHSEPETETEAPVQEEEPNTSPSADAAAQRRHSTAIIKMDQVEGNRSRKVQELDAEEAPRLVVVSAELRGQEYACIRTEMKIGRTDDNDIVIDHRSLSRTHAKVVREENGEWRIIDMQSANGLTVNGESYAQAPLNHGDIVELGHVKMKFVAAGEPVGSLSVSRSKMPLVLGLMGAVLVVGVGGAWALKVGPFKQGAGPKQPQVAHQDTPPPEQAGTPDPGDKPNPNTAADPAKALQGRLQNAQQAYEQGDFDKAIAELKNFDGTLPPEGQSLLDKSTHEQDAQRALNAAREALKQKKFDQVQKLAEPAKGSEHFGSQYDELIASLPQETPPQKTEPVKPPPSTPNKPPAQQEANAEEDAKRAYQDAAQLLKARQYNEALVLGEKCLTLMPKNADCYVLMAAVYARLDQPDKSAEYYRRFLKIAPDHKLAPKVRETLEKYEKGKGGP